VTTGQGRESCSRLLVLLNHHGIRHWHTLILIGSYTSIKLPFLAVLGRSSSSTALLGPPQSLPTHHNPQRAATPTPTTTMQKAKVYAVVGSNIEQLGTELERKCKETAAATETEVRARAQPCDVVWCVWLDHPPHNTNSHSIG
jgi:hypothetical protein